ncbi:M23 family metallopeptidase [Anabaena sp. 4-3]|uniref:M23 family metallopeptidase n=1 Tax=Anabaena sp. 4-3 TaxID=1811979 RepID=UPI0009ED62C4|nr:M23 family metallopeptidase [Anabaena sp. 4-3]
MRKNTLCQFFTYSLIGLISFSAVLITNTTALTQVASNSSSQSIPVPSAELIWPTQGYISQGFNKYRHEGIDIAGASGTPIFAAAGGTVVKAGWDNWGLGNAIEIKHPNGSITVYGHNRRLLVSKSQQVKQGQIIAEMGSTGNSTAPHLHFEYYPNGRVAADPRNILPSAIASKNPAPQTSPPASGSPVNKPHQPALIPIPVTVKPATATECTGVTLLKGETTNIIVKVCQENGQLFYIGLLKQDPSQLVKIPAWNIGNDKYQADNGSFSYLVTPEKVEIWRNGSQIRTDTFYTLQP